MKTRSQLTYETRWLRAGRADQEGGFRGAISAIEKGARVHQASRVDWSRSLVRGRPFVSADLVRVSRHHAENELWLILLDASASTARYGALSKAKGVMQSLLQMAYRERVPVALLEASGNGAQWRAKAQRPPKAAEHWFGDIGAGGGTPLQDALTEASVWLARRHYRYPQETRRVFIITDGRVRELPSTHIEHAHILLIDIESGGFRLEKSRALATMMAADYVHVDQLSEYGSTPEFFKGDLHVD